MAIGALIGIGASLLGGLFGNRAQKRYLKEKTAMSKDIRTKYLPDFTKRMYSSADQWKADLNPFYDQYLKEGSPLLAQRQRAASEQIGEEGSRASRAATQKIGQAGYGFAPSGLAAGVQGDIARSTARSSADAYLTNLLENENFKFQAAEGKERMYGASMQAFNPGSLSGFLGGGEQAAANVDAGTSQMFSGIAGGISGLFQKPQSNMTSWLNAVKDPNNPAGKPRKPTFNPGPAVSAPIF